MLTTEEHAAALQRLKSNERVRLIRILVADNACPVCRSLEGAYPRERVPLLPPEGCSCPYGLSRTSYAPDLAEIYP